MRKKPVYLRAVGVEYFFYLLPAVYHEAALPGRALRRQDVKAEAERPFEKPRQARGKGGAGRDDAYLRRGEGVAVHQHAVAFRHGVAFFIRPRLTQLGLGLG